MLEVFNLSVNYRRLKVLDSISLTLQSGEWVGLIGPNGAGKSTLIKAILGLTPCRGRVLWQGAPIRHQRQHVAYVPQRSQIDWDYPITAWTVVMMAYTQSLNWRQKSNYEIKRSVSAALERVDMFSLRHRQIGRLSGGQQQRIILARALAQKADLFLLDEPFTGIDKKTEAMMLAIFADLRSQGKTLLVCSHEWGTALNHYDRLLLLNQRLLANDTPQAVMTIENIQQAYGTNIQPAVEGSHSVPFVC
jgi:manganese/iron transport system ATP-binding protein